MAVNLGGFFVSLGLKSSADSFARAIKDLKDLGDESKRSGEKFKSFVVNSIKGLEKLSAAALGSAYAVSNIQAKMALTATKAGMGYTEFNKFSSALKLVGLDSTNVAGKIADVNSALNDIKVGVGSEAYASLVKKLALLGISDINAFTELSPTEQVALVAKTAESYRGTENEVGARDLADEILGLGDVLMATQQKDSEYKNFAALLSAGASATWSSNESDVTKNSQAFNSLKVQMDQMWKAFGETMGTTFRPVIGDFSAFIKENKDEIKQFFKDIAQILSDMITLLSPIVKTLAETTGATVGAVAAGSRAQELEKKSPEQAKRITTALLSKEASSLYSASVWDALFGGEGKKKGVFSQAEEMAFEMESRGAKYSSAVTDVGRKAAGVSSSATSVVIGDINLSGVDFNQFVNYMQANPSANKYSVAAAALAATNNMAGTK